MCIAEAGEMEGTSENITVTIITGGCAPLINGLHELTLYIHRWLR